MAVRKDRGPDGAWVTRLPTISGGIVCAAAMVFAVRLAVDVESVAMPIAWALMPLSLSLAVVATFAASGSAGTDLVVRRFWRQISATMAICAMASTATAVATGGRPIDIPNIASALYLTAVMTMLFSLLRLPLPARSRIGWLTLALDFGIVIVAFGLAAWSFVDSRAATLYATTDAPWVVVLLLAIGAAGVIGIAKVALAGAATVAPDAMRVFGITVLLTAFLGGLGPDLGFLPRVNSVQFILPLAAFGFVVAADRQRRASTAAPPTIRRVRPFSLVPYIAVTGVLALFLFVEVSNSGGVSDRVLSLGAIGLTVLVIIRQLVAFVENARLLVELDRNLFEVARHEHRLRSLLRHSSDIITVTNTDGLVTYASPGVVSVLHLSPDDLIGTHITGYFHPEDLPVIRRQLQRLLDNPGVALTCQSRLGRPDGVYRWLEIVSTNLLHDPDIGGIVSNARDITENRRFQDELAFQATHDELTGLANRTLFVRLTETALSKRTGERLAIALVDLDDFKTINDRLGHAVGDALLEAIGQRLVANARPGDTVARLGGDEFGILLNDVDPDQHAAYAQRIVDELAAPVNAGGHELLVRASAGVAAGGSRIDAGELLRRADVAMYEAKAIGYGRCVEFDTAMDARAREHSRLAADLSVAVEHGEVHLRYQPIVALPGGAFTGVEALVRWIHPTRGMISPAEFVPVAERTGLIVPLGAWVMHEACRQEAAWLAAYGAGAPRRMNVNVSARQLIDPDFPAMVESALLAAGLPADRLTIEITETAVFDGGPALEAVQAVRELGIRVALDDFGTGHSSLGLLRTCPVDVLKVDKSFVDGVGQSIEQEAIVTSVSQIGTAMRLQVVAEGVETAAQADRLYVLGYRFAQGFHFARPMTAADVSSRLAKAAAPRVPAALEI